MKERIDLYNRYKANIWLQHIDEDLWKLSSSNPEDLQYMRVIYNEDNKGIFAIDPSGGPFLSVGSQIEQYTIKEIILEGFVIRMS